MNAQTTTARKILVDGKKYAVPETFPSPSDLVTLASIPHESAQHLAKIAKNILNAGLSFREVSDLWEKAESAFFDALGISWQEALTSYQEMQQDQPEQEAYPACLPPASSSEVEQMKRIYETSPRFRPVSKAAYCLLFKGAASSRRHGVSWKVWGERAAKSGAPRALVALIASRAYTMASEQVKGF